MNSTVLKMFSKWIHKHIYYILIFDSTTQDTSTLRKIVTHTKNYNCAGVKWTYNKIHKYKHDKPTLLIRFVWLYT